MTAKNIVCACLAFVVMFVATMRSDVPFAVLTLCWCVLLAGFMAGGEKR